MTSSRPATARPTAKPGTADASIAALERPTPAGLNAPGFGSDVVADTLRALDIPFIALTPGASYRGLHDSIVNYLGNTTPQMLLCVHEESAVAIAHGYAKVTGKALVAEGHRRTICRPHVAESRAHVRRVRVIRAADRPIPEESRGAWHNGGDAHPRHARGGPRHNRA